MAYTSINFETKEELKAAVAEGKEVRIYTPYRGFVISNGRTFVKGPHNEGSDAGDPYSFSHRYDWEATVELVNGVIVKIIK